MKISVAIELYGSYDPVETPKPLWGSPGAELSTWTTFQFCCETAIHGHALRHGPPELYSAIQRYTLYSYTAIQRYTLYNLYNTPLGEIILIEASRPSPRIHKEKRQFCM
jgi:hypothetical protein